MLLRPEDQFHVGIVVDDLAAAIAFFAEPGMKVDDGCRSRVVGGPRG